MAWRVGATANNGQVTTSATCAITVPVTAQVDDWGLVTLVTSSNTLTITSAPSGWSLLSGPDRASASNNSTWLYGKKLVSGDINATATWTAANGSSRFMATLDVFSAVSALGTIAQKNHVGTNTSPVDAAISTVVDNSLLYSAWVCRSASQTSCVVTLPSSPVYTADTTVTSNAASLGAHTIQTGHYSTSTHGSYGSNTGASSPASQPGMFYTVELEPSIPVTMSGPTPPGLALAGPIGTVVIPTTATGVTPPNMAVAPASGTVVAGASFSITGNTPPNVAIAPLNGSASAAATAAGPSVDVALSPFAGTVGAAAAVTISGPLVDYIIEAIAGTVSAPAAVTMSGFVAPVAMAPLDGTVTAATTLAGPTPPGLALASFAGSKPVVLFGDLSGMAINAPAGTVESHATAAGPVSTFVFAPLNGTVTTAVNATAIPVDLIVTALAGGLIDEAVLGGDFPPSLLMAAPQGEAVGQHSYIGTGTVVNLGMVAPDGIFPIAAGAAADTTPDLGFTPLDGTVTAEVFLTQPVTTNFILSAPTGVIHFPVTSVGALSHMTMAAPHGRVGTTELLLRRWTGTEFKSGGKILRWDGATFRLGGIFRRWNGSTFIPPP